MTRIFSQMIVGLWVAWGVYWSVAARDVKVTLRPTTFSARLLHAGPLVICALLFLVPRVVPEGLDRRFLPQSQVVEAIGTVMVAVGLAFAVWARHHLGPNWSSVVELKRDHVLIQSGPYRVVRHPIYTGLLLGLLGSCVALGEWRGLLGSVLAFTAILLRVRAEDALMARSFGETYRIYRRETPALVPYLF